MVTPVWALVSEPDSIREHEGLSGREVVIIKLRVSAVK